MPFRNDSPSPPLLPDALRPNDDDIATGEEKLRSAFKNFLNEHEGHFMSHINGETDHPFTNPLRPQILHPLSNHCVGNDGILRGEHTKHHFHTVVDTLDTGGRGPIWSALVELRAMQLNLAGDDDFANTWKVSLMYPTERLAHLVFNSNNGVDSWGSKVVRTKEAVCAVCLSEGRDDILKGLEETVTILPCSKEHTVHRNCAAEWTKRKRHCPECGEYIL